MEAPQNPAGAFVPEPDYAPSRRAEFIADLSRAPALLRQAVAGLSEKQLDTRYRNWTIRQIVHHVPDSHLNSYVRFKWALTEVKPVIKAYDEGRWAALEDAEHGDIQPPLALLEGLHVRWVQLLRSLTDQQFVRTFVHPQTGNTMSLHAALRYYAWHGTHHTAQITWLRQQHGW
jgi:uncharacterized damage-inducible protein DinB